MGEILIFPNVYFFSLLFAPFWDCLEMLSGPTSVNLRLYSWDLVLLFTLLSSRIMNILLYSLIGAALGLGLHHGLFIHGEWHVRAPQVAACHLGYFTALVLISDNAYWMTAGYLLAMFSSIVIYRVFLHRLKDFPGPLWARISKIWHAWKARHRQNYLLLAKLHHEYGDFVRTGASHWR